MHSTYQWIAKELKQQRVRTVVDFGAGEGMLTQELLKNAQIETLWAVDSSVNTLARLQRYAKRAALHFAWGSYFYYDDQWKAKDAIILHDLFERVESQRLEAVLHLFLHDYFPKHLVLINSKNLHTVDGDISFQEWCHTMNVHQIYTLRFQQTEDTTVVIFTRKEWTRP